MLIIPICMRNTHLTPVEVDVSILCCVVKTAQTSIG